MDDETCRVRNELIRCMAEVHPLSGRVVGAMSKALREIQRLDEEAAHQRHRAALYWHNWQSTLNTIARLRRGGTIRLVMKGRKKFGAPHA